MRQRAKLRPCLPQGHSPDRVHRGSESRRLEAGPPRLARRLTDRQQFFAHLRTATGKACHNCFMGKLAGNGPSVPRPKSEFSQTMEVGQERMENRSAGDPAGDSSVQTETLRRPAVTALMFGVVALALFWSGIGNPGVMIYDEANYVPAAKAFLNDAPNPNPEAPPLGKLLIAVAIKAVGDNPFGWRVAGSVCGALTLTAVLDVSSRAGLPDCLHRCG